MKKVGIVLLVVGIALILFSLLCSIAVFIMLIDELESAAIGIVGGADGPTLMFVYETVFRNPVFYSMAGIGVIAVVISVIMLIKEKRKK
ncbi:MAG: hypothetical protein IJF02_06115 [Oscillospiraceae bacterium]|nr:hypothetical protein [Oscillospiraceae bacterium]